MIESAAINGLGLIDLLDREPAQKSIATKKASLGVETPAVMMDASMRSNSSHAQLSAAQLAAEESRKTKRAIAEKKRHERQFQRDMQARLSSAVR